MQRLEPVTRFSLALASTVFLFMGGIMVPPLGIALLPLVPQPALMFGLRYGIRPGTGLVAAAIVLLLATAGLEPALIYGLFALVAVLLLVFLGRVRTIEYLVFGIAAAVFGAAGVLLFYFFGSWAAMYQDFRSSMLDHFVGAMKMQERLGFPPESLEMLKERAPEIVETMLQLLPALIFASLGLIVLLNFVLLYRRFPENRARWLSLEALRDWKAPEPLVWGFIGGGFALFLPVPVPVKIAAANALVVIAACYFFQGLAIVAFYFDKNNVPRFFRAVTYLFIIFQQIFTFLVIGVGLFDLWVDFRRLKNKHLNPSQAS